MVTKFTAIHTLGVAQSSQTQTYDSILRDIRQKRFKPVYFLAGEEGYFIDKLVDAIEDNALTEEEKGFNLQVFYGIDARMEQVIGAARSYPMGAERSVVELREAQQVKNLDLVATYLRNPLPSTILVITYRNAISSQRQNLVKAVKSSGVVFESVKVKDSALFGYVKGYVEGAGFTIEPKAAMMIGDSIGTDLSRLYGELDKLLLAIRDTATNVTPAIVEKYIGISKDFNYFELQDAIVEKDVFKANLITKYFDRNQKNHPIQQVLPMLFRFFSTLMVAHYSPQKSEQALADYLGVRSWQARTSIIPAMRAYSASKTLKILDYIRQVDARSKGEGGSKVPAGDLMRELIYFILH